MITRSNSSQVSKLEHVCMNNVNVLTFQYIYLDETTAQEQQD
jgi:hypothetical protein